MDDITPKKNSPVSRVLVSTLSIALVLTGLVSFLLLATYVVMSLLERALPVIVEALPVLMVLSIGASAAIILRRLRSERRTLDGSPSGLRGRRFRTPSLQRAESPEQRLLKALHRLGEATPARVALEASLPVDETYLLLTRLCEEGHLTVRAEAGRLLYSL